MEHRLFSRIRANWQGEPLESYEKALKFVRTTTTASGLKARAVLNTRDYPMGTKIAPEEMEDLSIRKRSLPRKLEVC